MDRAEQLQFLCDSLLEEMPQYRQEARRLSGTEADRRMLLRCLMNVR